MSHEQQGKRKQSVVTARKNNDEEQRKTRRNNRGVAEHANWGDAPAELLTAVICAVSERGCAIQFGYTRDGGAFAIRIVGDGEPYNEYIRPSESIKLHLSGLLDDFTNGIGGSTS